MRHRNLLSLSSLGYGSSSSAPQTSQNPSGKRGSWKQYRSTWLSSSVDREHQNEGDDEKGALLQEESGEVGIAADTVVGGASSPNSPPSLPGGRGDISPTGSMDDADVAAGQKRAGQFPTHLSSSSQHHAKFFFSHSQQKQPQEENDTFYIEAAPLSEPSSAAATLNEEVKNHPSDLEFFEDLVSEPVLVLGYDISHLPRPTQFMVCATGVFMFSLLYGYLQELISVEICNRQLGLFLAMMQFSGYTVLAWILRDFVYAKEQARLKSQAERRPWSKMSSPNLSWPDDHLSENHGAESSPPPPSLQPSLSMVKRMMRSRGGGSTSTSAGVVVVPLALYLGLSLLRAVDLAMTNLAMQYINYPAKTLMKSSRVVFTMMFGVLIARKSYKPVDYLIVVAMVLGLALFMHADANSSAVFHHTGVIMLIISLLCDGAISNVSETIMSKYGVGQDEFIFRMYSIALVAITAAAAVKGDLTEGLYWMSQPGTYDEMKLPLDQRTWTVSGKIAVMALFSSMGFFGSSCSAAITKNFGALTMSITSTARKATTLFLSFLLFNNACTAEHVAGIVLFMAALTTKSLRRGKKSKKRRKPRRSTRRGTDVNPLADVEIPAVVETTTVSTVDEPVPTASTGPHQGELSLRRTASNDGSVISLASTLSKRGGVQRNLSSALRSNYHSHGPQVV